VTNRTDQAPDQPSPAPVDTDATADSTELLARAQQDYATAQARTEARGIEAHIRGNDTGGR
jgi:hypothetical protein